MSEESKDRPERTGGFDEALEREIQEALGGKSLEDLLEESVPTPKEGFVHRGPLQPGEMVKARVVTLDRQNVLVEIGPKDQGMVPREQFEKEPARGDVIDLEVSRFDRDEDMWVLSRHGAVERATMADLREGQIVEGMIEGANKGGLEIKFGGGNIRGFMPLSQISIYRVEIPADMIGQKIRCQVLEVDRREKRVTLSGRAVMELEQAEKREKLMAELAEGDVRDGIVRQVMPYGAFVDMGGVDGLVHVSQISYSRIDDPTKVLQPGTAVKVKVLKIDTETGKISLGMKQVGPDPWDNVENKFPPGVTIDGLITRLADFGAFCQIEPGLEGLIPISEITWTTRLKHPSEILQVGQTLPVKVMSVDTGRKRISLSVKQAQANPWSGAAAKYPPQSELEGLVKRLAEFGAFVELEPGVEGLVHISELSNERVRRVEDVLQVGQVIKVRVLEADEGLRRISLTVKGVTAIQQDLPPLEMGGAEAPAPKKRTKPLKGGLE